MKYRVYKAGMDRPVRVADAPAPPAAPALRAARSRRAGSLKLLLVVALFAGAVTLSVLYGRQAFDDLTGTADVAAHIRRLSPWALYAAPVLALVVLGLMSWYVAFGRRVVVKVVFLTMVAAMLATPGFALGYVDRSLSGMGAGGTAEQRASVSSARTVLQRPMPSQPLTILLLGIDHSGPGDPGRSDSQILVRLDPVTRTISMLSMPRDLRVDIPGVGLNKLNAAYTYGGVKLTIQTFEQVTGVPINHFVRIDFGGFWHLIDLLGGVYLPIDHRYYNPEGTGFQPINVQPGYQLADAKTALRFVRFRHDQEGDFTRMVRQQLFLREVQRQAMRWNGSWTRVIKLARSVTKLTTTDLDSLQQILPIADMALSLDTSHISQVHVTGSTPTIGGVSYVVASPDQITAAVYKFEHPDVARSPATASASASASPSPSPSGTGASASPAAGGASSGSAGGSSATTKVATAADVNDWSGWQALAAQTSLTLEAPTTWAAGLAYDTAGVPFRAYTVPTPDGRRVKAAIAVGTVTGGPWNATEYWGVQALRWADPPAIAHPNSTRTIGGRTYLLFSQDQSLHMVAWHQDGTTYWVINTLDNLLSNQQMMKLAESCRPLG